MGKRETSGAQRAEKKKKRSAKGGAGATREGTHDERDTAVFKGGAKEPPA